MQLSTFDELVSPLYTTWIICSGEPNLCLRRVYSLSGPIDFNQIYSLDVVAMAVKE
jgi:hypothetical protein